MIRVSECEQGAMAEPVESLSKGQGNPAEGSRMWTLLPGVSGRASHLVEVEGNMQNRSSFGGNIVMNKVLREDEQKREAGKNRRP